MAASDILATLEVEVLVESAFEFLFTLDVWFLGTVVFLDFPFVLEGILLSLSTKQGGNYISMRKIGFIIKIFSLFSENMTNFTRIIIEFNN